jgi:hypothetical protein
MAKNWPIIILGVAVVGVAAYLLTRQTTGERAWPPYQNQLETYNPSGTPRTSTRHTSGPATLVTA